MSPWKLAEITYGQVKAGPRFEVAVLPLGATEPHNLHLPYGTDTFQVEVVATRACEKAAAKGARVVQLPAIPYGTETNQMEFPLAMNLNPSTLARVIGDIVASLAKHGVHKLLILNGHGGNDLKWILRELHGSTPVHLFLCHWFRVGLDRGPEIFDKKDDHAGEMETSMGLAFFPDLVELGAADEGVVRPSRFDAVANGWVEITRPWHLLTTNSGAGDPRAATAAKGEAYTDLCAGRIADFLAELAASPLDDHFPFRSPA